MPDGRSWPVVDWFRYLGTNIVRHCGDTLDVRSRIESAGKAFGALRKFVFGSVSVTNAAKRAAYERLVLAIGLFGCECWCLTEALWGELRCFHAQCLRAMCRVTRKHTWEHHISTQELGQRMGLESIEIYVARRQARWLGHMARMPFERLPRQMLSAWVPGAKRPIGRPEMTYGASMEKSLRYLGIDFNTWPELASDRQAWHAAISRKTAVPRSPPTLHPQQQAHLPSPPTPPRTPRLIRRPQDILLILTPSPVPMASLSTPPVQSRGGRAVVRPRRFALQ